MKRCISLKWKAAISLFASSAACSRGVLLAHPDLTAEGIIGRAKFDELTDRVRMAVDNMKAAEEDSQDTVYTLQREQL